MARSIRLQSPSELLTGGGIFSPRIKKSAAKKPKAEPRFVETLNDYKELQDNLVRSLTSVIDKAYPNADFLTEQAGSHIATDTKLSVVLRACFGLSQMKLPADLVGNYQRTLSDYLKNIQHNPAEKQTYIELRNMMNVYKSLVEVKKNQDIIKNELNRLKDLGLPPKTVDRNLEKMSQACLQEPIENTSTQVNKVMNESVRFQSAELTGLINSLEGLGRQVDSKNKKPAKQAFTRLTENNVEDYQQAVCASA